MADAFTTIAKLINSPPGDFVVGSILAAFVWKAFEKWEGVASENDKIQVWIWLSEPSAAKTVEHWPATFARMFDRVFGKKHWSWKCFGRSCIASYCAVTISFARLLVTHSFVSAWKAAVWYIFIAGSVGNLLPDFISLLETRWLLGAMSRTRSSAAIVGMLLADATITAAIGGIGAIAAGFFETAVLGWRHGQHLRYSSFFLEWRLLLQDPYLLFKVLPELTVVVWLLASFFTSIWIWLYAGSGFLLKTASRFDSLLNFMNTHMATEKKPLQSIGIVAGLLVALLYWTALIVSRMVL